MGHPTPSGQPVGSCCPAHGPPKKDVNELFYEEEAEMRTTANLEEILAPKTLPTSPSSSLTKELTPTMSILPETISSSSAAKPKSQPKEKKKATNVKKG